ncbi:histidine--tRNA ligase [Patescibacteria group bacterium]
MPRTKSTIQIKPVIKVRKGKKSQSLKGFKDILPVNQKYWNFVFEKVKKITEDFSYQKIDTPILESLSLFKRSVGDDTDIVSKEMYAFEDKDGNMVTLRPEITASIVRSYIEHGMLTWPQPVKLWSWGPIFRHEKPQAGRYRQSHQFDFEVLGSDRPVIDAQLIIMANNLYKSFGLDVEIQVNSIGCPECRKEYIKELKSFINNKKLCTECKNRAKTNTLRVLDCKEKKCKEILVDAPQIIDKLCEDCKKHFVKVLENLDETEVVYSLNPFLVRGLDYYNRTTFEIYLANEDPGSQNALAGGGRYDYLVEQMGGRPTPAIGFAGGIERAVLKIKDKGIKIKDETRADVFVAQLGTEARNKAVKLFNNLRKEGIKVKEAFAKKGLTEQMEEANRLEVKYALILGQKEIIDQTVIIRNMESGVQEIVNFEKAIDEIKKRLLGGSGLKVYSEETKK